MNYRMKNGAVVLRFFIKEWQRRWDGGQPFNRPIRNTVYCLQAVPSLEITSNLHTVLRCSTSISGSEPFFF